MVPLIPFWGANPLTGSKDLTVRVFSREPVEGFRPPTLAGHRDTIVGVFFVEGGVDPEAAPPATHTEPPHGMISVSRDGAAFQWTLEAGALDAQAQQRPGPKGEAKGREVGQARGAGHWKLANKHFFHQAAKLTAVAYHKETSLLVAGFGHGVFMLYQ
eukprot:1183782-Prorocentrum_minimum.AAC.1